MDYPTTEADWLRLAEATRQSYEDLPEEEQAGMYGEYLHFVEQSHRRSACNAPLEAE